MKNWHQILLAVFIEAKSAINVCVANTSINPIPVTINPKTTPLITEITIGAAEAGVKKSHTFANSLKNFSVKFKGDKFGAIEYNYIEADYDSNIRATTFCGQPLKEEGLLVDGLSIYFNSSINSGVVEIKEWT